MKPGMATTMLPSIPYNVTVAVDSPFSFRIQIFPPAHESADRSADKNPGSILMKLSEPPKMNEGRVTNIIPTTHTMQAKVSHLVHLELSKNRLSNAVQSGAVTGQGRRLRVGHRVR